MLEFQPSLKNLHAFVNISIFPLLQPLSTSFETEKVSTMKWRTRGRESAFSSTPCDKYRNAISKLSPYLGRGGWPLEGTNTARDGSIRSCETIAFNECLFPGEWSRESAIGREINREGSFRCFPPLLVRALATLATLPRLAAAWRGHK